MSGSSLGSLYVDLEAHTEAFARGMETAGEKVEAFAKKANRVTKEVSHITDAFVLAAEGALLLAKSAGGEAAKAHEELENATRGLAVSVSQVLIPAVKDITHWIRQLSGAFQSLSPETRAQVAHFVEYAAAAFAITKVLRVLFTALQVVGATMEAIGAVMSAPFAVVLLGIALVVAAVVALHAAWRTNFLGIRDMAKTLIDWFVNAWDAAVRAVRAFWSDLIDGVKFLVLQGIDLLAGLAKALGKTPPGFETMIAVLKGSISGIADDVKSGATASKFATAGVELGKKMGAGFLNELKLVLKDIGASDLWDSIAAKFSGGKLGPSVGKDQTPIAYGDDLVERQMHDTVKARGLYGTGAGVAADLTPNSEAMSGIQRAMAAISHAAEYLGKGLDVAGRIIVGRLGEFGSVLSNVVEGAKAGGIWGAIVAFIADLLSRSKAFGELVQTLSGLVMSLVDAVEPFAQSILPALKGIIGAIGNILTELLKSLGPLFDLIGGVLTLLVPIIQLVAMALKALAPLMSVLGGFIKILLDVLKPVIQVIFAIAKPILIFILSLVKIIGDVWNSVVSAIASVVDTIVSIFTLGADQHGGNFLRKMTIDTGAMQDSIDEMNNASWDNTGATAANTAETYRNSAATSDATHAMKKFTAALTNAPDGFKEAAARWAADNGMGPAATGGGSSIRSGNNNTAATGNPSGGNTGAGGGGSSTHRTGSGGSTTGTGGATGAGSGGTSGGRWNNTGGAEPAGS